MWINSLGIDNGDLYINNLFADVQNGYAILKARKQGSDVSRSSLLLSRLMIRALFFLGTSSHGPLCRVFIPRNWVRLWKLGRLYGCSFHRLMKIMMLSS